jgi:hypothetical protein
MGDVTHDGEINENEFKTASEAHQLLDAAGIRYSISPGNHDVARSDQPGNAARQSPYWAPYFGPSRFLSIVDPSTGEHLYRAGENYGYLGSGESNWQTIDAPGQGYLAVDLEWMPRKDALCWADDVIAGHPERKVVVTTHGYLYNSATGVARFTTKGLQDGELVIGAGADTLWEELISRHNNVFAVLAGHATGSGHTSRAHNSGEMVHEFFQDFQAEALGGNGWLRYLDFQPSNGRLSVVTKSVIGAGALTYPVTYESLDYSLDVDLSPWTASRYLTPPPRGTATRFRDRTANPVSWGYHFNPQVAIAPNGDSVVVWEDDSDHNGWYDIMVRGFDAAGCERFPAQYVNTVGSGDQRTPRVAIDARGSFAVVWADDADSNGWFDIFMRTFNADGTERTPRMEVNSVGSGQEIRPDVAVDDQDRIVVVWQDDQDSNGWYQILGKALRIVSGVATTIAPDFTVNTNGAGQQFVPRVAMNSGGDFVVTWQDDSTSLPGHEIYARGYRLTPTNTLAGLFSDIRVNTVYAGHQANPAVAMGPAGSFVIAWQDDSDGNGTYAVKAKGFALNGTAAPVVRIPDLFVTSVAVGNRGKGPEVSVDELGQIATVWTEDFNVRGRVLSATGAEVLPNVFLSTSTKGDQAFASVAARGGRILAAWQDDIDSNGSFDVVVRGLDAASWGN